MIKKLVGFNVLSLVMFLSLIGFVFLTLVWAKPVTVHPDNPRYLINGTGDLIYLTGSHSWYNIHYNSNNPQMSYDEFEIYLDWMQGHGHTFTRLWAGWSCNFPSPWIHTGPALIEEGLNAGLPKGNMRMFNQTYFDTLRERVLQIQNRGMYVSVMFFGSLNELNTKAGWRRHTWHPDNNVNPKLSSAFSTKDSSSFFTSDPDASNIQKAFVNKIIDTLNDVDNLIWEIGNEARFPESVDWQYEIINHVRRYESTKPKKHLVGMTADGIYDNNIFLRNSPADWISPDQATEDNYMEGGPASYQDKVVINDVDHLWGLFRITEIDLGRKWVWKTFLRGNNPILMDCYTSLWGAPEFGCNGSLNPVFDPIRAAMGHTATFAHRMNLSNMIPSDSTSICSTRYCLYNSGVEYLVYQPISGSFAVNLIPGDYDYEWFNPSSGSVVQTGTRVVSGGSESFTPPFSGDAVLYIYISPAPTYECNDGSDNDGDGRTDYPN